MAVEKIGYEEVELEAIRRSSAQARQSNVNVGMDELVDSIASQGLLEPIHVIEVEKGKLYELVDGQRRFQAFSILHEKNPQKFSSKIPSIVYKNTMEGWEKKTMSLHANLMQAPMTNQDRINAVTVVYETFGSIKYTARLTGFSEYTIRKYVRASRLPENLKTAVKNRELSVTTALDAADLYSYDADSPDDETAAHMLDAAKEMQKLAGKQKSRIKEIRRSNPEKPVQDIIADVKTKQRTRNEITVTVESDTYARIGSYQKKEGIDTIQLAAADLVEDGLEANGE